MSILDVTEDQIFHTLGKGKDPNFKPIEKVRPVVPAVKKTYTPTHTQVQQSKSPAVSDTVKLVPSPEVEESIKRLTTELSELNKSVGGIQKMIKWYILLFAVNMVLFVVLLGLFIKYYQPS